VFNDDEDFVQSKNSCKVEVYSVPKRFKKSLKGNQFREFAAALLGPVHFLSPDQQSGIHCLIIYAIQLLTPNNLGGT